MTPIDADLFGDGAQARPRLRVVAAPPGQVLPQHELLLVAGRVLTIGRAADNDLILPDESQHVSHWHCRIEKDGVWKLKNCSATHGTHVNDRLLAEGQVVVLAARDVVRIADYLLRVEADGDPALPRWEQEPVLEPRVDTFPSPPPERHPARERADGPPGHARRPEEAVPGAQDDLVAAFLAAAGLQRLPDGIDPAAAMRALGEATRLLLGTLSHLHAARRALKLPLRIERRNIAPIKNNPFTMSVDEGLMVSLLLGAAPSPDFTSGPAAMADACRELVEHDGAFLAGLQASLDLVMQRLSPAEIAAGLNGGLIGRKARLWERYKAVYEHMKRDVSPKLAGQASEVFAAAYDAHARRSR